MSSTPSKYEAKSYRNATSGKWVPSGNVTYKDELSSIEVHTDFSKSPKTTEKEANAYFLKRAKRRKS